MTIHAYFGDNSQLNKEKLMFEDLLTQLKLNWQYSEDWVYLFYNTMWSGQEIDVIAFTQNSIVVIDLKNYSGDLSGSENGEWLIDQNVQVLGGSQINPFVQVRKNKFAVLNWFQLNGLFSNQNLGFISGCIIFNELSSKNMELSVGVKKWFFVTDIAHSVDTLSNIRSNGIDLSKDDVVYLVDRLKLREYIWDKNKTPRDIRYTLLEDTNVVQDNSFNHIPAVELKYSLEKSLIKNLKSLNLHIFALSQLF